jgi:nicotinate-nucleotide--dimethylbenzimidazole phosphoribosyltransferase
VNFEKTLKIIKWRVKMTVKETIEQIRPADKGAKDRVQARWNAIAKPLHSLGNLEDMLVQIAGITGKDIFDFGKKALIAMCADNGVVAEGVTQTGQEVTAIVAENFLDEQSCAAIMCKHTGADIFPIDIGMAVDTPRVEKHKIAYGTKNMAVEPAMTRQEAVDAIEVGIAKVKELSERGYSLIATGEMGIGNTTTSSAIASVLLDIPPKEVTGHGAGLSKEGYEKKLHVIEHAIALHQPKKDDVIDVLSKVGGFDLAGLTGVYLGSAAFHIPVIIDGFISAVAALMAVRLAPDCADYLIASHVSAEPAGMMVLDALGKKPSLTCNMCLGEGTGAVLLFPLLDMAAEIYHKMGTFEDNAIDAYEEYE